jgi:hypothetical protein
VALAALALKSCSAAAQIKRGTIMYSNEIEIPKAVITAIHHKVEDDKVQTRITVTGTLLPDLAERLDVHAT